MKKLHSKVNIVPVIAKADCLTKKEIQRLKCRIMQEIEDNGIKIYPLPDCDSDEDEEYKEQVHVCVCVHCVCWGGGDATKVCVERLERLRSVICF